ncbi:protein of unknown function [Pseudodesulfovibrio profundus]|uniref:Uncharacterized protein n=1 Tax=Pseudodesulfovibrio profundus TaxID=57320 RepID=A0A2C8FCV7_9BACT|nr:protein of unknown function [Pseudodesulfovibrio profundus]
MNVITVDDIILTTKGIPIFRDAL